MRQPVPFGKYLLLDRVSVGGMAEIFKAKSYGVEGFEKIIAIKRILPSMGEDREFIKMFIDEAKIVGQLAHANICQIFELGRIEGTHFIAMEYIWGKDVLQLQNRLKKLGQVMDPGMACHIVARICEGLDYAHRKRDPMGNQLQIVHRDCSPQNVLVSYEGEVKIIDFGIAKASMRSSRTMAGVLKGKFGYMSPEQVRGLPLDRRSDIFALGTVLYEILTRERLFQAESDFSTLEKVRNVAIDPPRAINPDIPQAVEDIVMKALAPDPDDRYQWCSEMLGDLQRFLMSEETVFTSKSLSEWMKEHFNSELMRERKLMEGYKKIGRDGLIAGVPQAEAELDVVDELGEAGESEDPTMLGGPTFEEILGSPSPSRDDLEETYEEQDFATEPPTEVFGEVETNDEALADIAQADSARHHGIPSVDASGLPLSAPHSGSGPNALGDLGQAKTLLQPSGSAAVRAASTPLPPAMDVPGEDPAGPAYPGHHSSGGHNQMPPMPGMYPTDPAQWGNTASVARLPAAQTSPRSRSPLLKDIAIGVGIALLVLLLFLVVKLVFFPSEASSSRPSESAGQLLGSVSINVPEGKRAEVVIDGRPVGEVVGGTALVVSDLQLGSHTVQITQTGAEPCQETVLLSDNNVAGDVDCALDPLVTQLIIEGITPDLDVQVDGQSVPRDQRTQPIQLKPGTLYDVVVLRDRRVIDRFTVTLDAGQTVRRELRPGAVAGASTDDSGSRARRGGRDDDDERRRRRRRDAEQDKSNQQGEVGYLIANSNPWSKVFIDGKDTGLMTPIVERSKIPLKPGKHQVTFEYQGKRFSYSVTIKAGEISKLSRQLPIDNKKLRRSGK